MKSLGELLEKSKLNPMLMMVGLFGLVLIAAFGVGIDMQRKQSQDQEQIGLIVNMRGQAYQLQSLALEATEGKATAFPALEKTKNDMEASFQAIVDSNVLAGMEKDAKKFQESWKVLKESAATISKTQKDVVFLHEVSERLIKTTPELRDEFDNISEIMLENNAPAAQVSEARKQVWRLERIVRNVEKMRAGSVDANVAAEQFNYDANLFAKVLNGMMNGDAEMDISQVTDIDAMESLEEVAATSEFLNTQVGDITKASPALFAAAQGTTKILENVPSLVAGLTAVEAEIGQLADQRKHGLILVLLGIVGVVLFVLIGFIQIRATSAREQQQKANNERNQKAILRLLDELADLADGDLTTTATVTEDITGAIADSINYTIDQLRDLVSRINDTAINVATAAQETKATALHLAEASEHQAQEIAGASAAVNEMAVTIDQVSANAAESAAVAERSVAIANKGAEVVQNTIQGMDNIREQIQETSKRIKRLGESSQEIGDIVSLINDIADQTNILALNAAIQASMAGEAGRGFAVVADEVQRLAERSAAATKQIEALVKTIQTDTNEAVASMEQTTAEVVRGARLAQDAGVALEEIENVSITLAELIQNISNAARQQASSAGHISNTMNVIQEITSQTSAGTNATAQSIGHLAEMAVDLRSSVENFKLPEEESSGQSMAA